MPQAAHAGHTDGGKKFDAGNDPKYDRPVERQIEMEKTLPDHRKGGEGKDPTTVDPGSYTDHDRTGRGQDELDEGVGNRQGQPRERSVHALKRLFRWAHKINLFDGSRALKMNCAEITRRFCDVLNGDAPRVAKGNRFGTGEWHDVTLEHMGLADFPPENKFIRPAGHDGDFGVDHQAFQLVRDRLTGRPPGTHANIGVSFKKGGHRFAAFVDLDGSVKWFDGQVSEAARKLTDGSPEQLAAIMRDMVKDGSKLPLGVNIEHLEFAVREPGGHWEGPPRTAEHESAAVMRHRREEGQLRPSEPLDLDALPPSATMSVPEWFAAQAKHHASPATTEPSVWEQLQGEQSGHGSDDGAQRPEWQQEPDGRPSQWAPPRVDQRRYPAGPAAPGDPWGGAGDHWPQDFGPTGTPGGPGRFGPTGTPGGPGHFGPSGADGPGTFGPRGTDGPGSFGPGGTDGPGTFGPTGVVEPPRERWYEGVQPVAPGGRSTRTYHPSDWHPQGPWRSELADPNFRASKADGEALRRRYQPYSKRQLDEFRRRGRISLGEKEMAKLTDIDIQASELLLNDFVENMNRAFHLGDVRVEKHPVIRCAISAMHKMPNFTGTVHRGVRIRDPKGQQAFVDSHELGGTVRYKGFTHSDKNVAGGHRYEIMVHIESRFGKDMTYLRDPLQGIEEVIHLPHSDFYPVPVPPDWAHAPAGLDAGATKFQDADGRWHLFVRDHTGPYHPSEAMPPDPQPYPSFGPLGHDTGTYVDPQYGGPQQQGGYEHPQQDSAAPEDWVPGDADFGRTTKAGFDPAFHHKALGPEFAPRVNDPDGAFDGPERELADRLVEEGWQVDGRLEDTRVEGTKNPEAMVRRDPSDVGRITEFKTPSRYTRNALRNAIKAGSRQVPDVGGEVVVDGRGIGLLEVDARDAYRAAAGQRGDRLASQVHIILGDGRMLTFVKEQ